MKTLRTYVLTLLAFITVMTAIGLSTAPKLMAALKAALVQNIDEPARNPYQEGRSTSCALAGACVTTFSPVPAGTRLVITSVSGTFSTNNTSSLSYAVLCSQTSRLVRHYLPSPLQGSVGATQLYIVNQPVLEYFDSGEIPVIETFTQAGYTGFPEFTLAGHYVALP